MKRLVVIGGGFAGVRGAQAAAAIALEADLPLKITLLTEEDHLTVRPRLYLADPSTWRVPLRPALEPLGIDLEIGTATSIETTVKQVQFSGQSGITDCSYDALVIATGSRTRWPDIPGLREIALDIDTADAASRLLRHIEGLSRTKLDQTFVVIGAGFTGLEIATELRTTLKLTHGAALAQRARIILVDRNREAPSLGEKILPTLIAALAKAKMETRFGKAVKCVRNGEIELEDGERIPTETIIFSGGLEARSPHLLHNCSFDPLGRIETDEFLRVKGAEEVFVAGDAACTAVDDSGRTALMSCQHAIPMGHRAGRNAAASLFGRSLEPYRQPAYVTCLDLGPNDAVFAEGWDRQPVFTGDRAKAIKTSINAMIAPLSGTAETILTALNGSFASTSDLASRLSHQASETVALTD